LPLPALAAVAIGGRDETALREAGLEIDDTGVDHLAERCDVSDAASVEAFGDKVLRQLGHPSVIVACSGIAGPTKPLHEIRPAEWAECIETDLTGVYSDFSPLHPIHARGRLRQPHCHLFRHRAAAIRWADSVCRGEDGCDRTSSNSGSRARPTRNPRNSVCPGAVDGPRMEHVLDQQARALGVSVDDARRQFTDPAALKRLVRTDEVADACVFLASDAASGVTGEDMNVVAGLVMY
jgi:NAD(P)-dependent dehydrogenase (short-subunit alcohol dehydrogenase family)